MTHSPPPPGQDGNPDDHSATPAVSMVFIYYDNPQMLEQQIACWNTYAGVLSPAPKVLLVDDGSPKTNAADIVRRVGCDLPIQVFRIREDIPWNCSGARNLGCAHADGWIYVSDMDMRLTADAAHRFFAGRPLDPACWYRPKRVSYPDLIPNKQTEVNFLYHKDKFVEIGGYDEDYAGNYASEERDFMRRLRRAARLVPRDDVLVQVVLRASVSDSATRGLNRDPARNKQLLQRKLAAGLPRPTHPLRFNWERVL